MLIHRVSYDQLLVKTLDLLRSEEDAKAVRKATTKVMNYDGAEGLEFGGGNTAIDPAVAAGDSC